MIQQRKHKCILNTLPGLFAQDADISVRVTGDVSGCARIRIFVLFLKVRPMDLSATVSSHETLPSVVATHGPCVLQTLESDKDRR